MPLLAPCGGPKSLPRCAQHHPRLLVRVLPRGMDPCRMGAGTGEGTLTLAPAEPPPRTVSRRQRTRGSGTHSTLAQDLGQDPRGAAGAAIDAPRPPQPLSLQQSIREGGQAFSSLSPLPLRDEEFNFSFYSSS